MAVYLNIKMARELIRTDDYGFFSLLPKVKVGRNCAIVSICSHTILFCAVEYRFHWKHKKKFTAVPIFSTPILVEYNQQIFDLYLHFIWRTRTWTGINIKTGQWILIFQHCNRSFNIQNTAITIGTDMKNNSTFRE